MIRGVDEELGDVDEQSEQMGRGTRRQSVKDTRIKRGREEVDRSEGWMDGCCRRGEERNHQGEVYRRVRIDAFLKIK